jgi:Flp pilus assembly protein TadD
MIKRPTQYRLVALTVLLATLSGCRQFSGPQGLHLPWSKPARLGAAPALPSADESPPLRPEQKADIQIALARSLEHQGRTDDAKKVYLEAIKTDPQRADAQHLLGLLHARGGDCAAAERYYQEAIRLAPENAEPHCDLGYSCYLQQRWEEAESHLRQAIALAPDLRRAHNNLGLLLARTGREEDAFGEFAKAGCSEAESHANLAFALSLAERWDDAQAHFQRAVQIDPNLPTARQGLASLQSLAANSGQVPLAQTQPPQARIVSPAAFLAPDAGR